MDAVREFADKGGLVTTGGRCGVHLFDVRLRDLTRAGAHQEAGFHPLEVIEHATWNGAKLVGMEDRLGKVREGFIADLVIVNGNPLENLKLLNPYGTDVMLLNGRPASNYAPIGPNDRVQASHGGGIEWTIKDGIPYHVPDADARGEGHGCRAPARSACTRRPDSRNRCQTPCRFFMVSDTMHAPSLDVSAVIAAPAGRIMKAFFRRRRAERRGGRSGISVTTPRTLGPYAIEWAPTDFRDEILGRLGGVFRGTVMEFRAGEKFFVADAFWLPPDGDPIGPMALEVTLQAEPGGATRVRVIQSGFEEARAGDATTRWSGSAGARACVSESVARKMNRGWELGAAMVLVLLLFSLSIADAQQHDTTRRPPPGPRR